jgi:hypothetical protein
MELEIIMLSKTGQTQKDKHHMVSKEGEGDQVAGQRTRKVNRESGYDESRLYVHMKLSQ